MLLVRLVLVISILGPFCATLNSQRNPHETLQGQSDSTQEAWYSKTAADIGRSNRAVKEETLRDDIGVIRAAEPALYKTLSQEGLSADNSRMITRTAWIEFRKDRPNNKLEEGDFVKFAAEEFGILAVTSKPDGADIAVDARPWTDKTNAENGVRVGTRHVRVSMAGYEDSEGSSEVKKGKRTLFHADLKPKAK
ncbi:MAG: PEGA domain-containing protein [Candidatus Sulfotelmatobacter sp.]